MSIKNQSKEQDPKSETSPIRYALFLMGWVIFSIITSVVIMKFFETYLRMNGPDLFFYLLIFLFSIGLVFIVYVILNNKNKQGQIKDFEIFLKKHFIKECDFLDVNKIMTRKNIRTDRMFEKEDRKTWLDEEKELFRV